VVTATRREDITNLLKGSNLSYAEIGRRYGVSRERVRQIAKFLGLDHQYALRGTLSVSSVHTAHDENHSNPSKRIYDRDPIMTTEIATLIRPGTPSHASHCDSCRASRVSRFLDDEGDGFCIICGRPW